MNPREKAPKTKRAISKERFAVWLSVYASELQEAVKARPDLYCYPLSEVPAVLKRMEGAFFKGSYNLSGPALAKTCKALGLPMTYKAVEAYLRPDDAQGPANAHRALLELAEGPSVIVGPPQTVNGPLGPTTTRFRVMGEPIEEKKA
jgi:hypothetical protein